MDGYRAIWNQLIFGNDGLGGGDIDRYWIAVAVVAGLAFAAGLASRRYAALAPIVTAIFFTLYVAAVVPFMVWTAACPSCGASFSYDSARSGELVFIELAYGGFFAKGAGAVWLGALAARRRAGLLR
jgi:hypothetical protein